MGAALAAVGLIQLLACASFVSVARVLAARASGDGSGAQRAFVAWWIGMAGVVGLRGVLDLAAAAGYTSLAATVAERYVEIALIASAAWGMSYYVGYLYSGRQVLSPIFLAYFVLVALLYAWATYIGRPTEVVVGAWSVGFRPVTPYVDAIYFLVGVPIIVATLAYLSLIFRPLERIQRYRVAMVSLSILAWVVGGLAASLEGDPLRGLLAITGLGLVTAVAVYLAYHPPLPLLRRLEPEAPDTRRILEERARRREQKRARMSSLI